MSRYVQRCPSCRVVRGITSFTVRRGSGGGRSDVCRWCAERTRNEANTTDALRAKVRRLIQQEGAKLNELRIIRDKLARARGHLTAREGKAPQLAPTEPVERAS